MQRVPVRAPVFMLPGMVIAYILDTYPSLSETFIAREIAALRQRGVAVHVFALHAGEGAHRIPPLLRQAVLPQKQFRHRFASRSSRVGRRQFARITASIVKGQTERFADVVEKVLRRAAKDFYYRRLGEAWWRAVQRGAFDDALRHDALQADTPHADEGRGQNRTRASRTPESRTRASQIDAIETGALNDRRGGAGRIEAKSRTRDLRFDHIHAAFASHPAQIARGASGASGLSWSFSGHARDVFVEGGALGRKLAEARFATVCTRAGEQQLQRALEAHRTRKSGTRLDFVMRRKTRGKKAATNASATNASATNASATNASATNASATNASATNATSKRAPVQSAARAKIIYAPHGLDIARFSFRERFQSKSEADVPAHEYLCAELLSVGRLVEKKGFPVLLEALALLRNESVESEKTARDVPALGNWGLELRLMIIGDGPQRAQLEREIARLELGGLVRLAGALSHRDTMRAMHEAACLVVPSRQARDGDRDGLPNVVLEAAACGLPLVATRAGSVCDFVDDTTGVLCAPDDALSLARAIRQVFSEPEATRHRSLTARARVVEDFDIERNIEPLLQAFTSIATSS